MPNIAHQRLDCTVGCPVEGVLEIIGGKWKPSIIHMIRTERNRYSILLKNFGVEEQPIWDINKSIIAKATSKFAGVLAKRIEEMALFNTQKKTSEYFLKSAPGADSFSGVNISKEYVITARDKDDKIPLISKGQGHVLGLSYVAGIREISSTNVFLLVDSPLHNISGQFRNEISEVLADYLPGVQLTLLVTDSEYFFGDKYGANPVRDLLMKKGRIWKEYEIKKVSHGEIDTRVIKEKADRNVK